MKAWACAVAVAVLAVTACDDDEGPPLFPGTGGTGTGSVTGNAGRGGQDSTGGGTGGTSSTSTGGGGTPTGGAGGAGGTTSTGGGGTPTGGAGGTSTGGAGGAGGAEPLPCTKDEDCAGLQPPPFARCWLPTESGNNTCIQCVPGVHSCPVGNPLPWDCPLIYDNPDPSNCGLSVPGMVTYGYCCQSDVFMRNQ